MKHLLLTTALAGMLTASPIPNFTVDGIAIDPSDAIGQPVLRVPGSTWLVAFEDLPTTLSDGDYNDYAVVVHFNERGRFNYMFGVEGLSAHTHTWFWQYRQQEFGVTLWDQTSGDMWYSGDAARNYDNMAHAWAVCVVGCASGEPVATPEPESMALIVIGLIGIVAARRLS